MSDDRPLSDDRPGRGTAPLDDTELRALVSRARDGDDAAAELLLAAIHSRVRRWALVAVASDAGADDVAQETLIRVYRHLASFRGRARFMTWVYRVTSSAAADWRRRHRHDFGGAGRQGLEDERGPASGPTHVLAGRARPTAFDPGAVEDAIAAGIDRRRLSRLVRTFLEELPDRQRAIFDLADLQGYSPVEIGELLGMKPVSVRASLFKARRTIRRRVLDSYPELLED